jgi:hypothetical protein
LLNDYQNPGILILNQMRLVIILNTNYVFNKCIFCSLYTRIFA